MRRFIIQLILFTAFTAIFYISILFIWGNYAPSIFKPNLNYKIGSYGHMFTRLNEVKQIKKLDILFLGSSHTYRGFDTRIFKENGFNTFNLGSSAQTPIQTRVLLNRYLNQINPKLIIYEVYPETFKSDGIESSLDIIANDKNDSNTYRMVIDLNHIKTYNAYIYGTIRDIFGMNKSFTEPIKKDLDTYISGGYVESEIKHFSPIFYQKQLWDLNQNQLVSFKEVMNLLKQRNIDVILVYAPISPSLYSSYLNNYDFDELIGRYSTYYNFNEILNLNDSIHFYDAHHLNQIGVEIFNKKLIEILKKRLAQTHNK